MFLYPRTLYGVWHQVLQVTIAWTDKYFWDSLRFRHLTAPCKIMTINPGITIFVRNPLASFLPDEEKEEPCVRVLCSAPALLLEHKPENSTKDCARTFSAQLYNSTDINWKKFPGYGRDWSEISSHYIWGDEKASMERIRHVLFALLGRSKLQLVVLHIAIMKPTNNTLYVRKEPSPKVVQVRDKEWQSFVLKDCDCPLSILRYMRFGLADYQLFFSPIPSSLMKDNICENICIFSWKVH